MRADEIMRSPVIAIRQGETVARLCDLMQQEHVNGVPVVDERGEMVGIVTEEDVLYGTMGIGEEGESTERTQPEKTLVSEIMTSPAVCATPETDIVEICRLMWSMRIHRIPILRDGKPDGMVSAMDIVRAITEGTIKA